MTQTSVHMTKSIGDYWITHKYFYSIEDTDEAMSMMMCLEGHIQTLSQSGLGSYSDRISISSSISMIKNKLFFVIKVKTPKNGGRNRELSDINNLST